MDGISRLVQLLEADVLGVLVEALPAQVQVIFPDQSVPIAASLALSRACSKLPRPRVPDVVVAHFQGNFSLSRGAKISVYQLPRKGSSIL